MNSTKLNLLPKLIQVKQYLSAKVNNKDRNLNYPNYLELITKIDSIIVELELSQPKINIVSQDQSLSANLPEISQENPDFPGQSQFQVNLLDARIVENQDILDNRLFDCELMVLVGDRQKDIFSGWQQLIQGAIANHIEVLLVVTDNSDCLNINNGLATESWLEEGQMNDAPLKNTQLKDSSIDFAAWLRKQELERESKIQLPLDSFFVLTDVDCIKKYQQYLLGLFSCARTKLEKKLCHRAVKEVKKGIAVLKQRSWHGIKTQRELLAPAQHPGIFKQQIAQLIPKINKQQNYTFQKIKQKLHRHKAKLINPFVEESLIWQTQKIIQAAEIKIIKGKPQNFLAPFVIVNGIPQKLHLYLADLYQQEFRRQLELQWNTNNDDGNYAQGELTAELTELRQQITAELQPLALLGDVEIKPSLDPQLEFRIDSLAYLPILEEGSRMAFEYHFNQSKWFRLLAAAGVGVIIYLASLLFMGEGRFFGFLIVIYQLINLFTGQDVKELKLKQQAKELKRQLDSKYQVLIRLSAEKITQDLIAALDHEQQCYQKQIEAIAEAAREKLPTIKSNINQAQKQINQLKQDQQKVLAMINYQEFMRANPSKILLD